MSRLAPMFFLQFLVWGVWFVPFGSYLSAKGLGSIVGLAFGMQGLAALISPLIVGWIANRYVSAERLMAFLFAGAGACLFMLPEVTPSPLLTLAVVFLHFLFFIPTLPLATSIAMRSLHSPRKQFPAVRAFGPAGWIVGGLVVGLSSRPSDDSTPIIIATWAALAAAVYSFTLPPSKPDRTSKRTPLRDLFRLRLAQGASTKNVKAVLLTSFLIVIPLAFYYAYANLYMTDLKAELSVGPLQVGPTALQTTYQFAELALLLPLPFIIARFGAGMTVALGCCSWIGSYVLFATCGGVADGWQIPALILATGLQGVSYSCVFTAGAIYIEKVCQNDECEHAQSLLTTLMLGAGPILGAILASIAFAVLGLDADPARWSIFWTIPALLAVATLIVFAVRFKFQERAKAN